MQSLLLSYFEFKVRFCLPLLSLSKIIFKHIKNYYYFAKWVKWFEIFQKWYSKINAPLNQWTITYTHALWTFLIFNIFLFKKNEKQNNNWNLLASFFWFVFYWKLKFCDFARSHKCCMLQLYFRNYICNYSQNFKKIFKRKRQ